MPRQTKLTRPQAMLDAPQPPAGTTPAGRALWELTVASRASAEWTSADATLLAVYVQAALDVRRLDIEIATNGEIAGGRVSPLVKLRDMREARMLALACKLKLTPSSRYTARRNAELTRHAKKANAALAAYEADEDDLLATGNLRH